MHRSGRYASLREGLVGAWCPSVSGSFGYSLPDLSGYGNHGALTNMDPPNDWVTSGGKMALDFDDNNDYIALATSRSFQPQAGESFSIAAWVSPTSSTTEKVIFSHGSNGPTFYLGYNQGRFLEFAKSNVANTGQSALTTPISSNTWQHVVCTVTVNSDVQLFVNGVQKSSVSFNYTFSYAKQLRIGSADGDIYVTNSFGGQINDLRYYTRKLSQSELSLLYTGGRGVGLIPERRRWFYSVTDITPPAFTRRSSQRSMKVR